jgi:hypothetical protein
MPRTDRQVLSGRLLERKAVCVLCSALAVEVICGACTDKIRTEVLEHKRWEDKGGR